MACSSCGGKPLHKGQPDIPRVYPNDGLNMVEWLLSLGWIYLGNCNCRGNNKTYGHKDYPDYELWVSQNDDLMTVKKRFGQVDLRTQGAGGVSNYKDLYHYWLVTKLNMFQ